MSDFCFLDAAPPDLYPLSLHDALPISEVDADQPVALFKVGGDDAARARPAVLLERRLLDQALARRGDQEADRSEEHTSELQSLTNLVCRLLLEKKTINTQHQASSDAHP